MFPTEPVPERIGAYKVIRRLSSTGSADVYLGRLEGPMGFQRVCALKLVPNSIEGDARLAEELAREASICSRLNHPAVVRMFDFFEHDRRLVLVLEHVDGVELERLIAHIARRGKTLGDDAVWYIGRELVGALAHAHAATDEAGDLTPVVHRNVTPDTVIVGWDGQVRLTGFGLGKILGRTPDTVVGMIKGTPGYMAPEQARGERVTARADVYGVGVLLWSLLTGKRPPLDGSRPPALSALRSDLPREISAAIEAALEPSPDKRRITCLEIEQWLSKIGKLEAGRTELREKVLLLRGLRSPSGEKGEGVRTRAPKGRRRLSLRGVRPSQRPPGPGPLSVPPPPSSRLQRSEGPRGSSAPGSARPSSAAGASSRAPLIGRDSSSVAEGRSSEHAPPVRVPRAPRLPRTDSEMPQPERPVARSAAPKPWQATIPDDEALDALLVDEPRPGSQTPGRAVATAKPPPETAKPAQTTTARPSAAVPSPATASAEELLSEADLVVDDVTRAAPPVRPAHEAREPVHAPLATPLPAPEPSPSDDRALGTWRDVGEPAIPVITSPQPGEREAPRRLSRPLSTLESIGVAALTAALVVGIGIVLVERNPPAPAPAPTAVAAGATSGSLTALLGTSSPARTEPTSTTKIGAPAGDSTAAPDASNPDLGRDLPGGFGYVTVKSPVDAMVYVNGTLAGPTNQPVKAICGRRFVRVGTVTEGNKYPSWVAPGHTVIIACQAATTTQINPSPSPER